MMAPRLQIGERCGLQPRRQRVKALASLPQRGAAAARQPLASGVEPMAGQRELGAQHVQGQPGACLRKTALMGVAAGAQRARQGAAGIVEPLPRQRQQIAGGGQGARRGAQFGAASFLAALPAQHHAARQPGDLDKQLGAHRHRHFRRRGRGRRALVGGKIDQSDVGLVADRRNQRDHARRRGAHHDFLVERPQIFQRAAAARHDQQIRARDRAIRRQRIEAVDRGRDLLGRAFALHPHRPHQHPARKAVGQPMQNVADHRAGRRGHHADHLGQIGQ